MKNDNLFDVLENQKQEALPVILTPTEAMDILGVGKIQYINCSTPEHFTALESGEHGESPFHLLKSW